MIPISPFRTHDDLVFLAGQVGFDADGRLPADFAAQMDGAMRALEAQLEAAGAGLDTVLKATVYLARREDFAGMNAIFGTFFAEPWPPRTTLVTGLALEELLFEIDVVAGRRGPRDV